MGNKEGLGARVSVLSNSTVVCVEDDVAFRAEIASRLRRAGWRVFEVATGQAALDILCMPFKIDLVLANLGSGEFAAGLKAALREHPLTIVAAMGDVGRRWHHCDRFWHLLLPKPFPAAQLVQLLEALWSPLQEAAKDRVCSASSPRPALSFPKAWGSTTGQTASADPSGRVRALAVADRAHFARMRSVPVFPRPGSRRYPAR